MKCPVSSEFSRTPRSSTAHFYQYRKHCMWQKESTSYLSEFCSTSKNISSPLSTTHSTSSQEPQLSQLPSSLTPKTYQKIFDVSASQFTVLPSILNHQYWYPSSQRKIWSLFLLFLDEYVSKNLRTHRSLVISDSWNQDSQSIYSGQYSLNWSENVALPSLSLVGLQRVCSLRQNVENTPWKEGAWRLSPKKVYRFPTIPMFSAENVWFHHLNFYQ